MKKKVAIDSINEMPQDFELEELIERLVVIDKVEQGKKDVKNGHSFTHEEARDKLTKWLK